MTTKIKQWMVSTIVDDILDAGAVEGLPLSRIKSYQCYSNLLQKFDKGFSSEEFDRAIEQELKEALA